MSRISKIRELCQEYTELTSVEIEHIIQKAYALDELAEVFDCDIFIDTPLKDSTASIVLYHVLPWRKKSLYKQSPVGQLALKMNEPGVWRVSRYGGRLRGYKALTQEQVFIRQDIYPIDRDNKVLGTYILERPIHDKPKEDDENVDYITMSAKLHYYIDDAICFFNGAGKLIFQNHKADDLFNQIRESKHLPKKIIHFNDLFGDQMEYAELLLNEEKNFHREIHLDGKYFVLKRISLKEDNLKVAIILRDITQLKNKEAEIISKTEAIRETHHRIKNNLQTISSFLRMERRRASNTVVKQLLADNMNRIMSIATTHDILARKLGDQVDLCSVLKSVINNLHRGYSLNDNISILFSECSETIVKSDTATSVSLIVNELVQNSYNHAFPDDKKGIIAVKLRKKDHNIELTVTDDGIGFSVDEVQKDSLGLSIVKMYARDKLGGNITFTRMEKGTKVVCLFPQKVKNQIINL